MFGFDLVLPRLRFATVSGVDVSLYSHMFIPMLRLFWLVVYPSGLGLPRSLVIWLYSVSVCHECLRVMICPSVPALVLMFISRIILPRCYCLLFLGYCF